MQEHFRTTNLVSDAHRALQQAVDFSLNCQQPDGHWVAPVSADATFTAQYVMFKYAYSTPGLCLSEPEIDDIRRWLLSDQRVDGGWALAPDLPGNVSTSVEAYLALRLLGVPRSHPDMKRAADFILSRGGVASVRFFTRFFLATYGLVPWAAIPQMPAELILLPSWAKLNIYVLSSWARSTLIPILIVRHHEPVYSLPADEDKAGHEDTSDQIKDACSDFLDELWVDPSNKNVPMSQPLWDCFMGPEQDRDIVEGLFTAADNILSQGWISGCMNSGKNPIRKLALKRCMDWILDHQEASGDWAGFFPPIHGSVWALLLQGYPMQHQSVRLGLEALERLAVHDSGGKWVQSTISACWDTALVVNALCDARMALALEPDRDHALGMEKSDSAVRLHKPLSKAAAWLRNMQLMVDHGDWRIYANTQQAGGWSFQYYNSFYPDVDDTAVVIMTLVKEDPCAIHSECIANAVEWILGMQNRDGGWGAFDINNDARWLHKIPFSDMDSLVDPSTADVTGRMLECFGFLLDHRREHQHLALASEMRRRLLEASKPALDFLLAAQEESGAWWGRWGNNYNYGTTNVLRGLANGDFWRSSPAVHKATLRAVRWLLDCQNADGGWGETLLSYADPAKAGRGESTAAQTAWALDSLLRFCPTSYPACQHGVMWLIKNQSETPARRTGAYSVTPQEAGHEDGTFSIKLQQKPEDCTGASWPIDRYVGTGFPSVMYLGYPFYHHVFPIQALSRYIDCVNRQSRTSKATDLSVPIAARGAAEVSLHNV
ncbi:terpenoid cyclases/protein prenyltransferase alpha-alpha toroid [Diaporthe sp. PMI_573]|nr:terpenoid cyclases/protein prenyltransferase alpha-alpha toroid [Diaporthaceae sp. PMI_573]